MAKYYDFTELEDANAYVLDADQAEGLPKPGNPETPPNEDGSPGFGWTITWAIPEQINGLWRVFKHPLVESSSGILVDLPDPL